MLPLLVAILSLLPSLKAIDELDGPAAASSIQTRPINQASNYWYEAPRRPYSPILFLDLDDTLYSRNSGILKEFLRWIPAYCAKKLKVSEADGFAIAEDYYYSYGSSVKGLVLEHGLSLDDYEEFLDAHMDYNLMLPIAGLRELLEKVQARLVLITNSGKIHTKRTLASIGLQDLFEVVIHADFISKDFIVKPDPRAYTMAVDLTDPQHNSHYFFVDDNLSNVKAAREHGWESLHLVEPKSYESPLPQTVQSQQQQPIGVINSIMQIHTAWPQLFNEKD